ncbi:MAG: SpoIIE family protein phosphatase [Lachnospiraceae bacterium]|nr:SpoIIE family protein phosphatase [Lachnospiraceae bacterium]
MKKKKSLTTRTMWTVIASSFAFAVIALLIGLSIYATGLINEYVERAYTTAEHASSTAKRAADTVTLSKEVMEIYRSLTPEQRAKVGTEEYLEYFSSIDTELKKGGTYDVAFHAMRNFIIGVDDVYLGMYDKETNALVYIVDPDSDEETRLALGEWEEVPKVECEKFLNWDGEGILYDISNMEKYGWICTAGYPILDEDGELCEFVLVDVSIGSIITGMKEYTLKVSLALALATLVIAWIISWRMKRMISDPINAIADAAVSYAEDRKNGVEREHFSVIDIRTGDELENLSRVMAEMERDLTNHEQHLKEITAEKERINTELTMATQIQEGMLPQVFPPYPDREEFDLYASMDPAREVGGDFYDFFMIDDDHLGIVIADVSGKGIPAALFMMISKTILQNTAMLGNRASDILGKTNESLCADNKMDMFVTAWVGILDIRSGLITCSSAGHEYPAVYTAGKGFELVKNKHGFVLGGMEGLKYREYAIQLSPGDKLFVYTDGVPEATNAANELFGTARMLDALNGAANDTPKGILAHVREEVDAFVGDAEQFDDLTMLCLEYRGSVKI